MSYPLIHELDQVVDPLVELLHLVVSQGKLLLDVGHALQGHVVLAAARCLHR